MTEDQLQKLKFPIGKFEKPKVYTTDIIKSSIKTIEAFPNLISNKVNTLKDNELDWNYRPDGWTIRQVVHHCADSHMNAFIRFKLAMTEESPIIKPYDQAKWAMLEDSLNHKIAPSLLLLEGLHDRFAKLLGSLNEETLERTFTHPEWNKKLPLKMNVCLYAWHCKHHATHIDNAIVAQGAYN